MSTISMIFLLQRMSKSILLNLFPAISVRWNRKSSRTIKTPYCGDQKAWSELVESCPVPLVAAGGPKTGTLLESLQQISDCISAGGRGAVIGRNVWGFGDVPGAVRAFKAVVHDRTAPKEAVKLCAVA